MELHYAERPPAGAQAGMLILHHGRGSDENDLLSLADGLDPDRRLRVVAPRAPLQLAGSPGYHWYVVPRVGYPDPQSFGQAYRKLARLHDHLWEQSGIGAQSTVLGGFSMGAVMGYALGLGGERPVPAGLLAFSGFIPTVSGWQPSLADRKPIRTFLAHSDNDPVIDVGFARAARDLLMAAGLQVDYRESHVGHSIDPAHIRAAAASLSSWLATGPAGAPARGG